MGKVSITTINVKEFLSCNTKEIPRYKAKCTFTKDDVELLIDDINHAIPKGAYSLGSVTYFDFELVDGTSRLIVLSVIAKALNIDYPHLEKVWTAEELREIKVLYRAIVKSLSFVNKDKFTHFFLNSCTLDKITVSDICDSFSFFDSGSEKGKELEVQDILKAYHLVSMREDSEDEKLSIVSLWESLTKAELSQLFEIWQSLRCYLNSNESLTLSKDNLSIFEGVCEKEEYPYIKRLSREEFSLFDPIINGKRFFSSCFFFFNTIKEIELLIKKSIPALHNNLDLSNPSEMICYNLFLSFCLLSYERFGKTECEKLLVVLFKAAFALRFENASLSRSRVDEYVLSRESIFHTLKSAYYPDELLNYNFSEKLAGMKNITFKASKRVKDIDFDNDYDIYLKEKCDDYKD